MVHIRHTISEVIGVHVILFEEGPRQGNPVGSFVYFSSPFEYLRLLVGLHTDFVGRDDGIWMMSLCAATNSFSSKRR